MAEIVEAPNWASVSTKGRQKYPLQLWADGRAWHLKRGVDYTGKTLNFITNLRKAAKERLGLQLFYQLDEVANVDDEPTGLTIQAFNEDGTAITSELGASS